MFLLGASAYELWFNVSSRMLKVIVNSVLIYQSLNNTFRVTYKNPESDVSYFSSVFSFKFHVMSLCILLYKLCHYFSDIYLVEKLPLRSMRQVLQT